MKGSETMSFQENLRYYREKAGYKQAKDFAEALNIPYSTYTGYEVRNREPKYETLCKIADLLQVSTDDLLGRTTNIVGRKDDELIKKILKNTFDDCFSKSDFPFKLILIDIKKDVLVFNLVDLNENIISEVTLSKDFVIHNINSAEKIIRYRKKYDLFYSLLELSLDTLVENINYLLNDKNLSNKKLKELLDKKEAYIIYQRNVMKKAKYFYDNFLNLYVDENFII